MSTPKPEATDVLKETPGLVDHKVQFDVAALYQGMNSLPKATDKGPNLPNVQVAENSETLHLSPEGMQAVLKANGMGGAGMTFPDMPLNMQNTLLRRMGNKSG